MSVQCAIKNYDALKKQIENLQKAPKTVMKRTMADVRTRVPGWVATEVAKEYGINKKELMPTGGGAGKAGTVSVQGDNVFNAKIVYRGRVLTPTHFKMSPTAPGQNVYTLKASILKNERATLGKVKKLTKKQRAALAKNFTRSGTKKSDHSPIMLMHTGANSAYKTQYIPFQRKSTNRSDVQAIKTVSLPQMVSSERTAPNISRAINDGLEKRLAQHMKLLEK